MTTNHITDVDAGLRSRSHLISFENPHPDLWLQRCIEICEEYSVVPDKHFLKKLIRVSNSDARAIMSELEEYISLAQYEQA
jgi:replication-associated recombination protein RarA